MKNNLKQNEWVGVAEAANVAGRSVSTIRRIIAEIKGTEHLKRVPGKGGERVLFSRAYLLERFNVSVEPQQEAKNGTQEAEGVAGVVVMLERQLDAQNRLIAAMQRDGEAKSRQLEEAQQHAAQLLENLRQATTLNAALQTKILTIGERVEPLQQPIQGGQWYWVWVAVFVSLVAVLVVWLFLQWAAA